MDQTTQLLTKLGGNVQRDISNKTDYIVACGISLDEARQLVLAAIDRNGPAASESCEATDGPTVANAVGEQGTPYAQPYAQMKILSERQFSALLPAAKSTLNW